MVNLVSTFATDTFKVANRQIKALYTRHMQCPPISNKQKQWSTVLPICLWMLWKIHDSLLFVVRESSTTTSDAVASCAQYSRLKNWDWKWSILCLLSEFNSTEQHKRSSRSANKSPATTFSFKLILVKKGLCLFATLYLNLLRLPEEPNAEPGIFQSRSRLFDKKGQWAR